MIAMRLTILPNARFEQFIELKTIRAPMHSWVKNARFVPVANHIIPTVAFVGELSAFRANERRLVHFDIEVVVACPVRASVFAEDLTARARVQNSVPAVVRMVAEVVVLAVRRIRKISLGRADKYRRFDVRKHSRSPRFELASRKCKITRLPYFLLRQLRYFRFDFLFEIFIRLFRTDSVATEKNESPKRTSITVSLTASSGNRRRRNFSGSCTPAELRFCPPPACILRTE